MEINNINSSPYSNKKNDKEYESDIESYNDNLSVD